MTDLIEHGWDYRVEDDTAPEALEPPCGQDTCGCCQEAERQAAELFAAIDWLRSSHRYGREMAAHYGGYALAMVHAGWADVAYQATSLAAHHAQTVLGPEV